MAEGWQSNSIGIEWASGIQSSAATPDPKRRDEHEIAEVDLHVSNPARHRRLRQRPRS